MHENERFVIGRAPIAHGREGMPDVVFIHPAKFFRVPNISHIEWV